MCGQRRVRHRDPEQLRYEPSRSLDPGRNGPAGSSRLTRRHDGLGGRSASNSVALIDTATNKVFKTIPVDEPSVLTVTIAK